MNLKPSTEAPKLQEIVDYWAQHIDECGLAVDWGEAHERCWRCAYKSKLQLCHIVPESRKGSFTPSNLVLLCDRCHKDAPNTTDSRFMWIWIKSTCVPFYQTFLIARGIEEFIRMFGRLPFAGMSPEKLSSSEFAKVLDEEVKETIVHYGEGRRNPATLACIYARVEERIAGTTLVGLNVGDRHMLITFLALNPSLHALLTDLPNT